MKVSSYNVRKMEAQRDVCDLHVACAIVVGFEQKRPAFQLCPRVLC